jgi:hypothetical protein
MDVDVVGQRRGLSFSPLRQPSLDHIIVDMVGEWKGAWMEPPKLVPP